MITPDVSARMLAAAIDYHAMGFSIMPLPYGAKKCRAKWKDYQTSRASLDEIRQWFGGSPKNIAIIGGEVSGGLAIRDYDDADAYHRWAADHPDLAAQLPTVQTGRGYHVYFRTAQKASSKKFDDGELRAEKNYWLAPPSLHESGRLYEFKNQIIGRIPLVDWMVFCARKKVAERAERAENAENAERAENADAVGDGAIFLMLSRNLFRVPLESETQKYLNSRAACWLSIRPLQLFPTPKKLKYLTRGGTMPSRSSARPTTICR